MSADPAVLNAARVLARQEGTVFEWRSVEAQERYITRAAAIIHAADQTRKNSV